MAGRSWVWVLAVMTACDEGPTSDKPDDTTEIPAVEVLGSCNYTNTFSQTMECKEYVGDAWTVETATSNCGTASVAASAGTFTEGVACPTTDILGRCVIDGGTPEELVLVFPGTDPASCTGVSIGCGFGGGTFEPLGVCAGEEPPDVSGLPVFRPFEQVCVEPLAGEPAGASDGDVCTWEAISACTEPGREYTEYASCDPVFTQRPYGPYEVAVPSTDDDPRIDDAAYMAELAWVTDEVKACACTCCHSSETAPDGPAGWYIEAGPLWIDTLDDDGLAMLAGWVDSTAFGAFEPDQNNGFDRSTTGLPTSDVPRMVAFLEGELARRGFERSDFAETEPFGGPLYDQLVFEPGACDEGVGVIGDKVEWTGGGARYVYVLEAGSMSPGVPPNLDTPDGTLWRLDVSPDADPLASGVTYGSAPAGATQVVPAAGAAPALAAGTYYLVVLRDVYQPITRCLFTR
jgi:hypothetical protein